MEQPTQPRLVAGAELHASLLAWERRPPWLCGGALRAANASTFDVVHRHYFPHYHRVTHINTYTSLSSYSPWPGKTYGRMVELIRVEQRADKAGNTSAATGS